MTRNYKPPKYVRIYHDGIVRETDKAILVKINDKDIWLPKSQLTEDVDSNQLDLELSDDETTDKPCLYLKEWLALEKGLI